MERKPDLEIMLDGENRAGLEEALRWPDDAAVRTGAAEALAELGDSAAAESLAFSVWLDPEPAVQAAARTALDDLLGERQARGLVAMYRDQQPEDGDWLRVDPEAADLLAWDEDGEMPWTTGDVSGLIAVLRGEPSRVLRVQAAEALARCATPEAVDALVGTYLHGDDRRVRTAAREALEEIYGDEAGEIIANYAAPNPAEDEDSEEWEEDAAEPAEQDEEEEEIDAEWESDEDEEVDPQGVAEKSAEMQPQHSPVFTRPASTNSPVIRDENPAWSLWLLAALLLGAGILAVWLLLR